MGRLDDSAIRAALRAKLEKEQAADPGAVIIDELGLLRGHVRLDLAVVNGLLHGYEIKSDRDSLRRLEHQVEVYGRVLDHATLVVGDRYATDAARLVPSWWALLHAHQEHNRIRLKVLRHPERNSGRDPRALVGSFSVDRA